MTASARDGLTLAWLAGSLSKHLRVISIAFKADRVFHEDNPSTCVFPIYSLRSIASMATTFPISFENAVATIEWDAERGILYFTWKSFATGQLLYEALEQNIRLVQQTHATKQLTDTLYAGAFRPEDQHWISTEYVQRMTQAGLRYMVLLVPEMAIALMSQERVVRNARAQLPEQTCTSVTFYSRDDAIAWLTSEQTQVDPPE
jgi:hypothetical protein